MRWMVAAAVGMGMAGPAWAADQFDLVCKAKKEAIRYRVDITQGEWCSEECKAIHKIAAVSAGEIVFYRTERTVKSDDESYSRVDRVTGDWSTFAFDRSYMLTPIVRKGVCEPAGFSGFPTTRF